MCYCPTPTLYLNLALTGDCAFQLSPKKTHSVWFISVLKSGDMGQCPEKSPSPCNTCVIPVSLYKSMSWFVTKTRTHTHTHTLDLNSHLCLKGRDVSPGSRRSWDRRWRVGQRRRRGRCCWGPSHTPPQSRCWWHTPPGWADLRWSSTRCKHNTNHHPPLITAHERSAESVNTAQIHTAAPPTGRLSFN